MTECCDAVSHRGAVWCIVSIAGMLGGLPSMFVPSKVILLPLLLGHTMRVRGPIL